MIDDKLKLMCGLPIPIGEIQVKPYTLKEIAYIGYTKFMSTIGVLFLDTDYFLKELKGESFFMDIYEKKHMLSPFDFYMMFANGEFAEALLDSLSLILRVDKKDLHIDNKNGIIFVSSNEDVKLIIDKDVFERIVDIAKYQNGLKRIKEVEEDDFNPADEKAKALIEKMKANREKVEKIKSEDEDSDDDLDIFDIVSSITSRSNSLNKLDVLNLTLFQIYDELSRLQAIDAYENYIKASMSGAKLDGEIPHWSNKI